MIVYQHRIYRVDLKLNPNVTYIFGDNLKRRGMGGQAKEMRGESNALGVATKHAPTMDVGAFFTDNEYEQNVRSIIKDLMPVGKITTAALDMDYMMDWLAGYMRDTQNIYVVPADGIGTGYSELPTRAPRTFEALRRLHLAP